MNILVANIGSTSFKYCLFETGGAVARVITRGGYERVSDHGEVIEDCLQRLVEEGHLSSIDALDAVGFKTVLGKDLSGCVLADDAVLQALDAYREIAPAHNPPYAESIRQFRARFPDVKRVALFETAFYQWIPEAGITYAVPKAWRQAGIRRYGFHGASHKFVAERSAELLGRADVAERVRNLYRSGPGPEPDRPLRVLSCHLGGSSSVTGIRSGIAVGNSFGLSPQSGLPQNNRVGDLDSAALPTVMKLLGISLEEAVRQMNKEGGLLGLSGVSNDLRDIRAAAEAGNPDARLALDALVHSIRHYLGAYAFQLGGVDALVFTAGIGENNPALRAEVCAGLEPFGVRLDADKNGALRGREGAIHADGSAVQIWVIPADEEQVIARETYRLLNSP